MAYIIITLKKDGKIQELYNLEVKFGLDLILSSKTINIIYLYKWR